MDHIRWIVSGFIKISIFAIVITCFSMGVYYLTHPEYRDVFRAVVLFIPPTIVVSWFVGLLTDES